MSKPVLTTEDFEAAAAELGCDVPAIQAVAEVESPRGGFLPDGRPTVLFERHKFYQFTQAEFADSHPDLCNPEPGGYARGRNQIERSINEWKRAEQAFQLNEGAAMMAMSWGRFQIMGFNFRLCGCDNIKEFVAAMSESEQQQLQLFINFLQSANLDDELRDHEWRAFARGYNGPSYARNNYHVKIARAYKKYEQRYRLSGSPAAGAVVKPASEPSFQSPALGNSPDAPPIRVTRDNVKAWFTTASTGLIGIAGGVIAFVKDNAMIFAIIGGVFVIVFICWTVRSSILEKERMRLAADPHKYTVQ